MTTNRLTERKPLWRATESDRPAIDQVTVLLGTAAAVVVLSLLCISLVSSVQDFMLGNTLWNGLSDFSTKYSATELETLDRLEEATAGEAIVIVPELPLSDPHLAALQDFVSRGGKAVILDDFGLGNQVLAGLGLPARFNGTLLLDPLFCHRNPALPRISQFSPDLATAGIRSITLNHATALVGAEAKNAVAWSSSESYLDDRQSRTDGTPLHTGPFPVAARYAVDRGEVILIADSSIAINSMLNKDDNAAFLEALVLKDVLPGGVLLDYGHLTATPIDHAKRALEKAGRAFAQPQWSVPALLIVFFTVSWYFLWSRTPRKRQ